MFWKRRRYIVATLAFFGFFNVYALRVNLSIGIVVMTTPKPVVLDNGTTIYVRKILLILPLTFNSIDFQQKEFDWDSKMQGYILSSFFYGYIMTQLLGGWLATRVGGNKVFGAGICITAVLTLVTPFLAHASVYLLLAVRIIEGIFEVILMPKKI